MLFEIQLAMEANNQVNYISFLSHKYNLILSIF